VTDHGVLSDRLDAAGVRSVLRRLGVVPAEPSARRTRLVAAFAKSEANPRGTVRGRRSTMPQDEDIGDTRYSRCIFASVIASVPRDTRVYASTRAERPGPLGGGPVALIVCEEPEQIKHEELVVLLPATHSRALRAVREERRLVLFDVRCVGSISALRAWRCWCSTCSGIFSNLAGSGRRSATT